MNKYIDETEASRITGLATQTLRNWRCQRRGFPYVKLKRAVRYDVEDIKKFMINRRIVPED